LVAGLIRNVRLRSRQNQRRHLAISLLLFTTDEAAEKLKLVSSKVFKNQVSNIRKLYFPPGRPFNFGVD
jgi:hypothetical protein